MRILKYLSAAFLCSLYAQMFFVMPVRAETDVPAEDVRIKVGDVFRGEMASTVYYMGKDGFRYVFPDEGVFLSWFSSFDGVKMVSDREVAETQLGGNVTYRPGSRLVKIQSNPKTYAVDRGGVLRWIPSEAIAEETFGTDWFTTVSDIADAHFSHYTFGADVRSKNDIEEAATISDDKGLVDYHVVWMREEAFHDGTPTSPSSVTSIPAGATVVFYNAEFSDTVYTATADDDSWGTGTLQSLGGHFVRRFAVPGIYSYHCSYHPEMKGTIVVE